MVIADAALRHKYTQSPRGLLQSIPDAAAEPRRPKPT